ncbi:tail fiber domain-containing protein [Candidatus Sumerlaeota bacterium]|nr:tail fiber domain-containing protein [Candidatus Sumerlaeota bacterium]
MKKQHFAFIWIFALIAIAAQAAPESIVIQGQLSDAAGDPLSGTREYRVQFYDAATSGVAIGDTITSGTTLSSTGRFSIELTPPAEASQADELYYELAIDSASMPDGAIDPADIFPERVKVNSVLFAQTVVQQGAGSGLDADMLDGIDSSALAAAAHSHNLQDLSGAATDAQVPDNITVEHASAADHATTAGYALAADETQTLSFTSPVLSISNGNSVDLSALANDADADPANELQDIVAVLAQGNDAGGMTIRSLSGIETTPGDPLHFGAISDNAETLMNTPWAIAVQGDYAFVVSWFEGMEVIDISDPANPTHAGAIARAEAPGISQVYDICVEGDYAYAVSTNINTLEILDVSDPANPAHVLTLADNAELHLSGANSVVIRDGYAYVTAWNEGLEILDVSDPTSPTHVGGLFDNAETALHGAISIYLQGDYAYITAGFDDGVEILDISDPTSPTHAGAIFDNAQSNLTNPCCIYVSGDYAYVGDSDGPGVNVLDVSDPANPAFVRMVSYDNEGNPYSTVSDIQGRDGYLYIAMYFSDSVSVLDLSDPANPAPVGTITDTAETELEGAKSIAVQGDYAYVASTTDKGVEVLDVSSVAELHVVNVGAMSVESLRVLGNIIAPNLPDGSGTALQINGAGKILIATSSARFKENIQPVALDISKLLDLQPVTYNYKDSGAATLGYIAEQLDALGLKDLVIYDASGRPFSIAYQLIPIFQNELLKRQNELLNKHEAELKQKDAQIHDLKERLERLEKLLEE